MGPLLIVLGMLGVIYWVLFGRPKIGRLRGNRVYLRRGPGLRSVVGGCAVLLIVGSTIEHLFVWVAALLAVVVVVIVAGLLLLRRVRH